MAAENEVELTPGDKKYLKQIAQDHREQQGAVDEQGRTWTLGKLMGMGFTRRDAMAILSGIAVGIPFSQAVMQRVRAAASTSDSDGNVGLPADRVDVFADGVDANSVEAKDVLNAEIGDGVDYADPLWLAQSLARVFVTFFESIDGYSQSTSGSASITVSENQVEIASGGTSGSKARLRKRQGFRALYADRTWDKDRVLSFGVEIEDSQADRTDYYTTGEPVDGNQGFGLKITGGDLQGVTHDGTTENTTTLVSGVGTGPRRLRAVLTAGTDIEFFVDGTSQGTLSSNLPTGSNFSETLLDLSVENSTAADRSSKFAEYRLVQSP